MCASYFFLMTCTLPKCEKNARKKDGRPWTWFGHDLARLSVEAKPTCHWNVGRIFCQIRLVSRKKNNQKRKKINSVNITRISRRECNVLREMMEGHRGGAFSIKLHTHCQKKKNDQFFRIRVFSFSLSFSSFTKQFDSTQKKKPIFYY